MDYAIEVNNLSKIIDDKKILNNINLKVKYGEIYGFLGSNGAGKTSLMKTLYGLMLPNSGDIYLLGNLVQSGSHHIFSSIGSIIETPIFYNNYSARKNLQLHCGYMNIETDRIYETLELFGLGNTGKTPVKNFSLGMKQRLGLARAFISNPKLLILDEPINGLDPQGIIEIRELLIKINQDFGTTIFISSHFLDELSKIADTIGVINQGTIIDEISIGEIEAKNIDLETYYMDLLGGKTDEKINLS